MLKDKTKNMGNFNFEVTCDNCHHKFKYESGDIVIECGFEGVRCPKCGNWIYHSNDNTTNCPELWVARDFEGDIYAYGRKPDRHEKVFHSDTNECIKLRADSFPEVTWENSPKKVRLKLMQG